MPEFSTGPVVGWYDTLFRDGTLGALSDAQLLERFLAAGTAAGPAFDVLLGRHGPMVLGVCRRILRDEHAAADAFQATFLVLVRRAGAIRRRDSLAPWLHGVARRVALRARSADRLRAVREARAAIDPETAVNPPVPRPDDLDIAPALHDEIDRLPEKYRAPIVLCYLQGRTIAEASHQLGWPVGTVGGRLARARGRLRDRLVRRGLGDSALAAVMASEPAGADVVPRGLARSTVHAAIQLMAGRAATTVVSAAAAGLLGEMLRTMFWTRFMIGAGAFALLGALVLGAGEIGSPSTSKESAPQTAGIPAPSAVQPGRPDDDRLPRILHQASGFAASLTDPRAQVDTLIALAWAQIRCSDQATARASLDQAAKAAGGLTEAQDRCTSRVRIAQARSEAGDRRGGLDLLDLAVQEARVVRQRSWVLKSIAVAQCELDDRESARATILALYQSILTPQQRAKGIWTSDLMELAQAQIAVGDFDEAFRTCIPTLPSEGNNRHFQVALRQQPWMLMELASAASDANHESRDGNDPPRHLTDGQRAARLALVRRAVEAVEAVPEANERRPILAVSLAVLGAFGEALAVARRIDQKQIPGESVDATWALWRISMEQARVGQIEDARATIRELVKVEKIPGREDEDRRNLLAYGLLVARDLDGALKSAEALNPHNRASILAHVASEKVRNGDRAGAERLFRRAREEAERFRKSPPVPPRRPPRNRVPAGAAPEDPEGQRQVEYQSLLAEIQARAGDWASAEQAVAAMPAGGREQEFAAFTVAIIRSRSGDGDGVLTWAQSLPSSLSAWVIRGLAFSVYDDRAYRF
jgi:RNA polymerase sigma factor (sigma-70 family)